MNANTEYRMQNRGWSNQHSKFYIVNSILLLLPLISFGQKNKKYSEDLSKYRPRVELIDPVMKVDSPSQKSFVQVVPTNNINAKIDAVLDSIDRFNLMRKYVDGFTIQIYSGQRKDDAMAAKTKMQEELPALNANLQYLQPKFKVTVGKYFTRLEAQKDLLTLRKKFSNAILVPERILIK